MARKYTSIIFLLLNLRTEWRRSKVNMKSWKPAVVITANTLARSWKSAIRAAIVVVLIIGLGVGAQPSNTVKSFIKLQKIA